MQGKRKPNSNTMEERISELEGKSIEMIQMKMQSKKKKIS